MKKVRTRFAPSPTGTLHFGGARTALFNYLYAKATGGDFLLRIEDTDQNRSTEDSYREMVDSLRWLGLDWDEGVEVGGPFGPYRQSERKEIYLNYAKELLEKDLAYPCFCSAEELEQKKEAQLKEGKDPVYDGTCRHLSVQEREEKIARGEPHVIRLKNPGSHYLINDAVQGDVRFDVSIYGDFILIKSDGFPSYNFAVVMDDHDMEITHVIRGVGHLSNTPRQLAVYEAFGWQPPEWAHVSEIVGSDRKKLSKRHGSASVMTFRDLGYPREALINYMSLLGWSPGNDVEFMKQEELQSVFDIKRCVKSPAVFDVFDLKKTPQKEWTDMNLDDFRSLLFDKSKLNHLSAVHIRSMDEDAYIRLSLPWIARIGFIPDADKDGPSPELRERLLKIRPYMHRLEQSRDLLAVFYLDFNPADFSPEQKEMIHGEKVIPLLEAFRDHLNAIQPWAGENLKKAVSLSGESAGVKGKELFIPLRLAVTGKEHGMEFNVFMELLGKEKTLANLERMITHLKS